MLIDPYSAGLPWSAIQSWRRGKGFVECVTLKGESIRVEVGAFDHAIETTIQTSFPAPPGTEVCVPVLEEGGTSVEEIELWPALAFVIDAVGSVHPVTMQGIQTEAAIRHPDGRIEAFNEDWPDLAAYQASLNEKSA